MRKWLLAFVVPIFSLCLSHMAFAAEHSADTMVLDWRTERSGWSMESFACGEHFITDEVT